MHYQWISVSLFMQWHGYFTGAWITKVPDIWHSNFIIKSGSLKYIPTCMMSAWVRGEILSKIFICDYKMDIYERSFLWNLCFGEKGHKIHMWKYILFLWFTNIFLLSSYIASLSNIIIFLMVHWLEWTTSGLEICGKYCDLKDFTHFGLIDHKTDNFA